MKSCNRMTTDYQPMSGWNLRVNSGVIETGSLHEMLMKTLSRHLADHFPDAYSTRVEPRSDGYLVVHVGFRSSGVEAIRMMSGRQAQNGLLVETMLEDMRNELARLQ